MMKHLLHILTISAALAFSSAVSVYADSADNEAAEVVVTVPTVKSVSGGVEITANDDNAHHFYIYSITGQMIKSVDVAETLTIDLPQGYYIVKCAEWSKKIVVR